jgi:putative mycofactocin binding protein MftB
VGSTEPSGLPASAPGFDLDLAYELDPQVALREEPFGALAYHYGNRRLNFLRSTELVSLVRSLGRYDSAALAMDAVGVSPARRSAVGRALAALRASEVIRAR